MDTCGREWVRVTPRSTSSCATGLEVIDDPRSAWMIAHVRLVHDERTRAYGVKRTALGGNRKEILRRLKRYIAREVYPIILDALVETETRRST